MDHYALLRFIPLHFRGRLVDGVAIQEQCIAYYAINNNIRMVMLKINSTGIVIWRINN